MNVTLTSSVLPTEPAASPSASSMQSLMEQAREAAQEIRRCWEFKPMAGVILGTGLGGVAEAIDTELTLHYEDIPNFPCSTALSHAGRLTCGYLAGVPILAMEGRCHLYEGYPLEQLMLPVCTMGLLGAEILIVSNASGGLNKGYDGGDVMVMEDHINLMFREELHQPQQNVRNAVAQQRRLRFHPLGSAAAAYYDNELIEQALEIARQERFAAHRGTYVAMIGPNYETPAEYRFLQQLGGDVVGMSTVPEVLAAAHCGMKTLALSTVTNVAEPDDPPVVDAQEVVDVANSAEPKLRKIVMGVLARQADLRRQ